MTTSSHHRLIRTFIHANDTEMHCLILQMFNPCMDSIREVHNFVLWFTALVNARTALADLKRFKQVHRCRERGPYFATIPM